MVWSLLAVGAAGMLIGLRYRASALIAATFLTVLVGLAVMWVLDVPAHRMLVLMIYLVLTLQVAYLLGVAVTTLLRSK